MHEDDTGDDDLLSNFTKMIEEFLKNTPGGNGHVAGYLVVPGGPSRPPAVSRVGGDEDRRRLQYETIESDRFMYITLTLPAEKNLAFVDIATTRLRIFIDDRVAILILKQPIDVLHSHYRVHRRVLDVTLKKIGPVMQ